MKNNNKTNNQRIDIRVTKELYDAITNAVKVCGFNNKTELARVALIEYLRKITRKGK